jgi:hypothetical protein
MFVSRPGGHPWETQYVLAVLSQPIPIQRKSLTPPSNASKVSCVIFAQDFLSISIAHTKRTFHGDFCSSTLGTTPESYTRRYHKHARPLRLELCSDRCSDPEWRGLEFSRLSHSRATLYSRMSAKQPAIKICTSQLNSTANNRGKWAGNACHCAPLITPCTVSAQAYLHIGA